MTQAPKNKGGARPGAGRPANVAKGLAETHKMTVRLTAAQIQYVRAQASKNAQKPSEVLRGMVARIMALDGVPQT